MILFALILLLSVLVSASIFTFMAHFPLFRSGPVRSISGGVTGFFSSGFFYAYAPVYDFYDISIQGGFGIAGIAAVAATFLCLGIWAYNIWKYREVVV